MNSMSAISRSPFLVLSFFRDFVINFHTRPRETPAFESSLIRFLHILFPHLLFLKSSAFPLRLGAFA